MRNWAKRVTSTFLRTSRSRVGGNSRDSGRYEPTRDQQALGKEDVFVALTRATSRLDIITSSEEAFAYYDTQVPISGAEIVIPLKGLSRRKPFIGTRILYTLPRALPRIEAPRYLLGCTAVLGTYAFDPLSLL